MNRSEESATQGSSHGGTAYQPFPGGGGMPFGSETVVIPGKRPYVNLDGDAAEFPVSGSASGVNAAQELTPGERSKLWNRLFPVPDPEQSAASLDLLAQGLLIRNYMIEKRIGLGGMGAVFRAWDEDLERVVALKVLSPSYCRDPLAVKRFRNESRSAARLDHDNIARVYGIGESNGLHFIAFEYVEGVNIRDMIRTQGRLSIPESLSYILQIAAALKHTAAAHVFHRDIKPSNIIVKPNGRAKLVDWGLARLNNRSEDSVDLTSAGTTLGTFDYISPEQARDPRTVDLRSDIYSLGCTFYHMVTGEAPYSSGTMLQKLLDHQNKSVPNPALKNPAISAELAGIIMKMMASDPARRYQDAQTLLEDLYLEADHYHLTAIPAESVIFARPVEPGTEPFWRRHLGLISVVSLLLLAVFAVERFNAMSYSQGSVALTGSNLTDSNLPESISRTDALNGPTPGGLANGQGFLPSLGLSEGIFERVTPGFLSGENSLYRPSENLPEFLQEFTFPKRSEVAAVQTDPERDVFTKLESGSSSAKLSNPDAVLPDPGTPAQVSQQALAGIDGNIASIMGASPTNPGSGSLTGVSEDFPRRSPFAPVNSDAIRGSGSGVSAAGTATTRPSDLALIPVSPLNPPAETSRDAAIETTPVGTISYELIRPNGISTRYDSLKSAIQNAQQDQSIRVLPLGGVRETVINESISLDNKNVIIKGDPSNPVHLVFRPTSASSSEELFLLANSSSLLLQGLHLTVDLKEKQAGPEMSLCTVMDDSQMQLRNSTVTLKSGMYRRAVLANMTSDFRTMSSDAFSNRVRPTLSLESSMVRGAGHVVLTQRTHAAQVAVIKSGIAVQGAMVFSQVQGMSAPGGGTIDLQIERSTLATSRGLFEAEQDPMAMDLLVSSIEAEESIFLNLGDYPLVTLSGNDSKEGLLDHFVWSGDRNFFDRFGIMMLITEVGTEEEDYEEFGQTDWLNHWRYSRSTYFDQVGWKNPDLVHVEPLSWQRSDFALDDFNEVNPARNLGVGVDVAELPSFFEEGQRQANERLGIGRDVFGSFK